MDTVPIKPVYESTCPNRQIVDLIGNKWSILLLHLLKVGPQRFAALQRQIKGISQKMLTQTLRELERDGLVKRTIFAEVPARVEYELTPLGQTLREQLSVFLTWSRENMTAITTAQEQYDQQKNNL